MKTEEIFWNVCYDIRELRSDMHDLLERIDNRPLAKAWADAMSALGDLGGALEDVRGQISKENQ